MTLDLNRVIPDDVIERIRQECHTEYPKGSTVADIIEGAAGIGYGGHYDETSDEEEAVYYLIAADTDEYEQISAARDEFTNALRAAAETVTWPAPNPATCPRHGGPWGDDLTCPRCTNEDGDPNPVGHESRWTAPEHEVGYYPEN